MRSIGFTRRQTASAVVVMSLAIVAIGVLIGAKEYWTISREGGTCFCCA